jgi:hypothetical protein
MASPHREGCPLAWGEAAGGGHRLGFYQCDDLQRHYLEVERSTDKATSLL